MIKLSRTSILFIIFNRSDVTSLVFEQIRKIKPKNLISNIGFGKGVTHIDFKNVFSAMSTESINFPLQHPPYILRNFEADLFREKKESKKELILVRILRKLKINC